VKVCGEVRERCIKRVIMDKTTSDTCSTIEFMRQVENEIVNRLTQNLSTEFFELKVVFKL